MSDRCSACGAAVAAVARFCESCGDDLRVGPPFLWSATPTGRCAVCGGTCGPEGYCELCGRRPGAGRDHARLDLVRLAAVTDRGRRKTRNEDAVAIAEFAGGPAAGGAAVAIVCDGVSTSPRSDVAAHAATRAAMVELLAGLAADVPPDRATAVAFRAALRAVTALHGTATRGNAPSCTFVSAVVDPGAVTVGWVGDSRAYWVATDGGCRITEDDALPGSSTLTRWVGADAGSVEARVRVLEPRAAGSVVVCSDGLSRYLRDDTELAVALTEPPVAAAAWLTRFALDAGGADNIAVAVVPFRPPSSDESGASRS
jgi:serine/threonine protein phosphatase PrpC